jgi:zinc D-Ala-D-Ala carboxypeptidase
MKSTILAMLCAVAVLSAAGCDSRQTQQLKSVKEMLAASGMDAESAAIIGKRIEKAPERFFELLEKMKTEMAADSYLLRLIDKKHSLPAGYEPADLVHLDGTGILVSRTGHRLRKPAFDALAAMDRAARSESLELLVSSSYRSYAYQTEVFARNVAEMGKIEAERVSAHPGASQHQLGTAIDFGSITDAFALTAASKWLAKNAGRFGFSLSYPKGAEGLTGYVWESWHYRYIGKAACALDDEYFGGVQQYLMLFLDTFSRAQPKG